MQIISVWHLVESGRTLRINCSSPTPSRKNAVVFTKKVFPGHIITEDIRIASREVASLMRLRKYLVLSPGTNVVTGPFSIAPVDMERNGAVTNLFINEKYYFLSFIPDIIKTLRKESVLLIPASPLYFKEDSLCKILEFIKSSMAMTVILSGEYSDAWYYEIKKICKCTVANEVAQTALF